VVVLCNFWHTTSFLSTSTIVQIFTIPSRSCNSYSLPYWILCTFPNFKLQNLPSKTNTNRLIDRPRYKFCLLDKQCRQKFWTDIRYWWFDKIINIWYNNVPVKCKTGNIMCYHQFFLKSSLTVFLWSGNFRPKNKPEIYESCFLINCHKEIMTSSYKPDCCFSRSKTKRMLFHFRFLLRIFYTIFLNRVTEFLQTEI